MLCFTSIDKLSKIKNAEQEKYSNVYYLQILPAKTSIAKLCFSAFSV